MSQSEANIELKLHPRPSIPIELYIPVDALRSLEKVANARDMALDALLKLYIGQGLRQDTAKLFADQVLDLTAQVLTRHGQSEEQVAAIIREIRSATGS